MPKMIMKPKTYEEHHKYRAFLCKVSSVLFVAGLAIIVSVIYLDSSSDGSGMVPDTFQVQKTASTAVLWCAAIISIIVGILGCLMTKCHHKFFIIGYGCGLGTVALFVFIIGCIFVGVATNAPALSK